MIHSLRLKNFKAFEEQLLEFRPLTVLSGFNNTGKSSAFQSLLLLRQSYLQGVLSKRLVVNGDLVYMGTAQEVLFERAKQKFVDFEIFANHQEKSLQWCFTYDLEANALETKTAPATSEINNFCLFNNYFYYFQAERITKCEYTADILSVFENPNISTINYDQKDNLQEFINTSEHSEQSIANKLSHPQAKSLSLRDQVEAWMIEISSGTKNFTSKKYHPANVGFGISFTLPIVVALLASPPGSLIIIEYPEGHLHPSGQTKIGKLISLASCSGIQVIIETHSDHILNGIRVSVHGGLIKPDDVKFNHFQRREKQNQIAIEVISPRIDRNGRIDRWPDGFFDEWENNLEILLAPAEH